MLAIRLLLDSWGDCRKKSELVVRQDGLLESM